jgi:hypothetical protein
MVVNQCEWQFGINEFSINGRPVKLTLGERKERQFSAYRKPPERSEVHPTKLVRIRSSNRTISPAVSQWSRGDRRQ